MKRLDNLHPFFSSVLNLYSGLLVVILAVSCNADLLDETPTSFLNLETALVNRAGFESAITGLHALARNELSAADDFSIFSTVFATDVGRFNNNAQNRLYDSWCNPRNSYATYLWTWAFVGQNSTTGVIALANNIIEYAGNSEINWSNESEKNAIIAEARFFRAYTYNVLANTYGGVPIVDQVLNAPKVDFTRATRDEVYEFIRNDLEFASIWLPTSTSQDGRIVKAAADHLLSEVYISLGRYSDAIASATKVIEDGQYKLMTERFATSYLNYPGDVFSDLFKEGYINRSSGNLETIWAIQIEHQTPGGMSANSGGNFWPRTYLCRYFDIRDPNGSPGTLISDSIGRGDGRIVPTNYFKYDIWRDDPNDMRNSPNNIIREFRYNNPSSAYYGQKIEVTQEAINKGQIDTLRTLYPIITKACSETKADLGNQYGKSFKDYPIMRLAETYLLRAEAYILNQQPDLAVIDINAVRARANATPATVSQMSIDYILDERARELYIEEPRRRTLNRMGKLVERVRKYYPEVQVRDYNEIFPIPRAFIDANFGAEIQQNPGYEL